MSHRDGARSQAMADAAAERRANARPWAGYVPPPPRPTAADARFERAPAAYASALAGHQEASFAAEAGVDVETFRLLQALQTRDITASDYDLLAHVSTEVNRKTMSIEKVETLPLLICGAAECERHGERAAPGATCLVCQETFVAGERLRKLPCESEHIFHAGCIEEWLTASSARCPVDQQELSWR